VSINTPSSDVALTASVKALQERRGSRKAYRRMEERGGWETRVTPELAAFLAERDSAYLATANSAGHPYIQHRGGPKGFVRVLDDKTLGFADFVGNRQYITTGNLDENDRAFRGVAAGDLIAINVGDGVEEGDPVQPVRVSAGSPIG